MSEHDVFPIMFRTWMLYSFKPLWSLVRIVPLYANENDCLSRLNATFEPLASHHSDMQLHVSSDLIWSSVDFIRCFYVFFSRFIHSQWNMFGTYDDAIGIIDQGSPSSTRLCHRDSIYTPQSRIPKLHSNAYVAANSVRNEFANERLFIFNKWSIVFLNLSLVHSLASFQIY